MWAELTKVSASIIVNLPCQERVFRAGQRLPHVIREDQKVSRGAAEIYQTQMGSYSASLWHVDVRHYLSRPQQHPKFSRSNNYSAVLDMSFMSQLRVAMHHEIRLSHPDLI